MMKSIRSKSVWKGSKQRESVRMQSEVVEAGIWHGSSTKRISDKCGLNWSWQTICVRVKLNLSSPLINNLEWEMGKLKSCISLVSFIVKLAASATPTSCSDTCLYVWNKQTLHVHQCGFDELWPVWVFADRSAPTRIHTKAIKWY